MNSGWDDRYGKLLFPASKPYILLFPASVGIGISDIIGGVKKSIDDKSITAFFDEFGLHKKVFSFDVDEHFKNREEILSVSKIVKVEAKADKNLHPLLDGAYLYATKASTTYVLEIRAGIFDPEVPSDMLSLLASSKNADPNSSITFSRDAAIFNFFNRILFMIELFGNLGISEFDKISDFRDFFNLKNISLLLTILTEFSKEFAEGLQEFNIFKMINGLYDFIYNNPEAMKAMEELKEEVGGEVVKKFFEVVLKATIDSLIQEGAFGIITGGVKLGNTAFKASFNTGNLIGLGLVQWIANTNKFYTVFTVDNYYPEPYIYDLHVDKNTKKATFKATFVSNGNNVVTVDGQEVPILKFEPFVADKNYPHGEFTVDLSKVKVAFADRKVQLLLKSNGVNPYDNFYPDSFFPLPTFFFLPPVDKGQVDVGVNIHDKTPVWADLETSAAVIKKGDALTVKVVGQQGDIIAYVYDFGDGTGQGHYQETSITHRYKTAGRFKIQVKLISSEPDNVYTAFSWVTVEDKE